VSARAPAQVSRLVRFSLTTGAVEPLAEFYCSAFGCRALPVESVAGADFEFTMGVGGGSRRVHLSLGAECIELLQFESPGAPYPLDMPSSDLRFQHFAIVVADMDRAFAQLRRIRGWTAISQAGPEQLPAGAGGVRAFKFRDPEGHPLELLSFLRGQSPPAWQHGSDAALFLGIDHSAISVADSDRSISFYEALGLSVAAQSLNRGPEQARLDAIEDVQVEVTALALPEGGPHVELLCYRGAVQPPGRVFVSELRPNDVATTRLVFERAAGLAGDSRMQPDRSLLDPDGHHLVLLRTGNAAASSES
jgi:catechol 2,3-dioxygenase-like lactoylglutathione lyase family enzyme